MKNHRNQPRHQSLIHRHYLEEKHSLQGKDGKTHGVC